MKNKIVVNIVEDTILATKPLGKKVMKSGR